MTPLEAIPAAARYLVDHGARRDLDRAIHAYNHSWSYVARVKQLARRYARGVGGDDRWSPPVVSPAGAAPARPPGPGRRPVHPPRGRSRLGQPAARRVCAGCRGRLRPQRASAALAVRPSLGVLEAGAAWSG